MTGPQASVKFQCYEFSFYPQFLPALRPRPPSIPRGGAERKMALISASSFLLSPFSLPSRKPLAASPTIPLTREPSKRFRFPSHPLRRPTPPLRTLKCSSQRQSTQEFERLFSNLNRATMKREPGSVSSGIFLVAGTTIGAGILAIPAVTQEAGFLASAITCILCWIYMVIAHYRLGKLSEPSFNR